MASCMNCIRLTGAVCRNFMVSDAAASFYQLRNLSLTLPCNRTRGPIKLRSAASNLQSRKHVKYSDDFVRKEISRYNLSTRRLANMMGEDPSTFGEDDVKRAIRYLFPSDLDEDSLPSMDYPAKVYTSRLRVHWDENKRPFHYLYYTKRPSAYQLMHETYQYVLDARKRHGTHIHEKKQLDLDGTRWMTMDELSAEILDSEQMNDIVYNQIIAQFERLVEEEHSYIAEEFIMKHRKVVPKITMTDNILETTEMEDGRRYVTETGQKKSAIAQVKLIHPGTGKVTVNGKDFHKHFPFVEDRRTVLSPFTLLHKLASYDIEASVEGGVTRPASTGCAVISDDYDVPSSAQAMAIRYAIARGLRSFIMAEEVEMMRRAGLLTFDKRWRERKVFGQHRARKKYTWKRR